MTPEQEDALIYEALKEISQDGDMGEAIRLAIRAAVAQERERCAKLVEGQRIGIDAFGSIDYHVELTLEVCAAAIRRS